MMRLEFVPKTGAFLLRGQGQDYQDAAREAGLDWSKPARLYYTRNPYAALHFWPYATEAAADELFELRLAYERSWAQTYHGPHIVCPEGMEYHPFQEAGIDFARSRQHTLIGDSMGLGKTVQAIGTASECQMERVLAVVPAAARYQWAREVSKWYVHPKGRRVRTYPVTKAKDGVDFSAHWIIISYDLLRNADIHELLCRGSYDQLVLDEGHLLKTYEAKRTRAVFGTGEWEPLAERAEKRVALTGTPLPNRPRECYTLARGLDFDAIDRMSEDTFKARYNPSMRLSNGHVLEETGRLPELHNRLRCNFMVRRLKKDVLHQLPPMSLDLVYLERNAEVQRVLKAEDLLGIDPSALGQMDEETQGQVATLRREMGEAKVPLFVERIRRLFDDGLDKMGLFVWHKSVIRELEAKLGSFGIAKVDGSCTPVQKDRNKRRFIEDPSCRLFIGQIQAAGTALDGLQKVASFVDIGEPSWTPGENEQVIDRFHRDGQRDGVQGNILVAPGSFDEKVMGKILGKAEDTALTLDAKKRG